MKAVILAAGRGEGLATLTALQQKESLRICGRPLVGYAVEGLMAAGVREFVVVVNDRDDVRRELERYNAEFQFVNQRSQGIAGAVRDALDFVEDFFVLAFGDIVAPKEFYIQLLNQYLVNGGAVVSLVPVSKGVETYGLVKLKGEELEVVQGGSTLALAGAYVLHKGELRDIVDYLKSSAGRGGSHFVWGGDWVDVGYPEDVMKALEVSLRERSTVIAEGAEISRTAVLGKGVVVEEGAVVEDYAVVKGPCYIGRGAFIGNFSLIRDFSCIEEGASVGAYAEVAHSTVQRGAEVGSKAYLTHSIVGRGARVGASVVTSAKAVKLVRGETGKIGALIPPGAEIPHGTVLPPMWNDRA